MDEAETRTMVYEIFKGKATQKRIKDSNPVRCVAVDMEQFLEDEPPIEILEFEDKDDIV